MQKEDPATSVTTDHLRLRRRFRLTDHAMLRYIERGTRIPLDMYWLSLHRRQFAEGRVEDPTDWEILDHIERGVSLVRLRKKFLMGLRTSRHLYRTPKADFVAIGGGLVAVIDRSDGKTMTVITTEMAKSSMPISSLRRNGVLVEEPAPTLTEEERLASSGFRYAIGRTGFSRADLIISLKEIAPEVLVVALMPHDEVVVVVRLRASLEALRAAGGFAAMPYIAGREEFLKLTPGPDAALHGTLTSSGAPLLIAN
ncbi:hypothetical protein D3C71_250080 [compost metagenome]